MNKIFISLILFNFSLGASQAATASIKPISGLNAITTSNRYASVKMFLNGERNGSDKRKTHITFEKGKYAGLLLIKDGAVDELPTVVMIATTTPQEMTWQLKNEFYAMRQLVFNALNKMGHDPSKTPFIIGNILEKDTIKEAVISYPLPKQQEAKK